MGTALRVILAFVIAMIGGYVLSLAAYVGYTEISGTIDREGAMAMGVAFFIGPVVALLSGLCAAIWAYRRKRAT